MPDRRAAFDARGTLECALLVLSFQPCLNDGLDGKLGVGVEGVWELANRYITLTLALSRANTAVRHEMSPPSCSVPLSEHTTDLEPPIEASQLCRSSYYYSRWASSVGLDMVPRSNQDLPEVLSKILLDSRTIPRWLTKEDSPEYDVCRQDYGEAINSLSDYASATDDWVLDDANISLSQHVRASLFLIFGIHKRERRLTEPFPEPTEADRRCSIDNLGLNVWEYQTDEDFQYRLECTLQLPKADPLHVYDMKADSIVLIQLPDATVFDLVDDKMKSLSSLSPSPALLPKCPTRLLHWIIEYKRDETPEVAFRQVSLGLVSGLYQRRAFGFDNHFVFGIAHHSTYYLDVLAATWESTKKSSESVSGVGEINPGKGQASSATSILAGTYDRLPKAPSSESKIIVYRLATFNMLVSKDVLQLYLLLRSTRELAQQYREDIVKEGRKKVLSLSQHSPDIHSWPAPPRPPRGSQGSRSSTRNKKRKLEPSNAELGEPVGAVDEDTPIGFRHIQRQTEMDPAHKVRNYLSGLAQTQEEMLPLD